MTRTFTILVSKCIRCNVTYGCISSDKKHIHCKECSYFPCIVCCTDVSGGICLSCLMEKFSMISLKKGMVFGL